MENSNLPYVIVRNNEYCAVTIKRSENAPATGFPRYALNDEKVGHPHPNEGFGIQLFTIFNAFIVPNR